MADVESIRVSGTIGGNPARINDLTIDLIQNKYAHLSTHLDLEPEFEDEELDEDPPSLMAARAMCEHIALQRKNVEERKASADQELYYFQQYANTMSTSEKSDITTIQSALQLYATQRQAHFRNIAECKEQLDQLSKNSDKASKELAKELKDFEHTNRAKVEARERKRIEKEEKLREKKASKPETSTNVHRVCITIDLPEAGDADDATPSDFQEASLQLTYNTSSASWTPRYDIRLDTANPSLSTLTYRSHFTNRTFETWSNAHITLSTSEASFEGLNEKIPKMESWRVGLVRKSIYHHSVNQNGQNGLFSLAEQQVNQEQQTKQEQQTGQEQQKKELERILQQNIERVADRGEKVESLVEKSSELASAAHHFRKHKGWVGSLRPHGFTLPIPNLWSSHGGASGSDAIEDALETDGESIAPASNLVTHSTAGLDTYGFTTTYDLPTQRTIPSSPLVRRHVIAEISLPSLLFTYILIPKLKPAAFLKVKLTNTSDIPLLPGLAGLTLDGSFLGNLSFPRASPGETVVLELGVDQRLKVEYERPMVKHRTRGMIVFGKEEVGVYKRMMRLTNTKATDVSVIVLDQVPVPEDERLKVEILVPKGLVNENDVVEDGVGVDGKPKEKLPKAVEPSSRGAKGAGSPKLEDTHDNAHSEGSSMVTKQDPAAPCTSTVDSISFLSNKLCSAAAGWGIAKVTLRKNGEVRWDVDLRVGGWAPFTSILYLANR